MVRVGLGGGRASIYITSTCTTSLPLGGGMGMIQTGISDVKESGGIMVKD
jgi:hypothetical protein